MASQRGIIAHVVGTYLFRTENWIYNLIRFQTICPSIILTRRLCNEERLPHDRVYALSALPNWRWLIERGIRKLITGYYPYHHRIARSQQVQLLHAHFGEIGLRSLPLAKALDVPLITSFYGADMSRRLDGGKSLQEMYARLFEGGGLFLVEGPAAKRQLESVGCLRDKIRIQRLGVDLERIPYCPRRVADSAPIRVLMAATFTEKKGIPYGVEAFCQAARENNRLRLTVVGDARPTKPEEQQIKRRLKDLVEQYGMDGRVDFLGYVPLEHLKHLAYEHHVFLHPSVIVSTGDKEGGSPVVITEMAASGLPIISTHHCDIPQVVLDGKTGVLADERNVEQLRLAILNLATDDSLRLQMGGRGRDHVAEYFCARKQGRKLGDLYLGLLK